ncbi:alpha/beta-hydrolase [Serendipita vermifera]|nr:alpha/beta-hydrolase [Serendipita vermifera]
MHLALASILLALSILPNPFCSAQGVPIVNTTSGRLQGISASSKTNAYLGIPYAIPPLGQLRFQAPRPLITPTVSRNATKLSPGCIQLKSDIFPPSPSGESEDCLTLNVWSSKTSGQGKAVYLWIHGGGFVVGSTSDLTYNLTSWADAHPEIIFVSANYRLNLFGFAETPAITGLETNAGLRDQRLAIEWVRANIAAFGGDPSRIVIGGQSAGSASVGAYLYAHPYDSLISGAILQSGQPHFLGLSLSSNASIPGLPALGGGDFQTVATAAGCPLQGIAYLTQLACMKQKTTQELVNVLRNNNVQGITPYVDGQLIFSPAVYIAKGLAGSFARVPVLMGSTDNEADFFLHNRTTGALNTTLSDQITLIAFTCPDSQASSYSYLAGVTTYRYRYMARFPSISSPPVRAAHAAELPILFQNFDPFFVSPPGALELSAIPYLEKAWSSFITDPAGGLAALGWPKYKGSNGGASLVQIFTDNNVQSPILVQDPKKYDAPCSSVLATLTQGLL